MGNAETRLSSNAIDRQRVERNFRRIGGILGKKQGGTGSNDPDTVYVPHSLATAANDFVVASGVGVFVKKTLAQVKSILGLGSAAYLNTTTTVGTPGVDTLIPTEKAVRDAIPAAGVTDHGALTGLADDDHTQYHNDTRGDARYPLLSLVTAKGDILAATASGVLAKLAAGTDAWSLVADSSEPTGLKYANVSAAGVTDHGALTGLGDDDHTIYVKHALATATSDFVVASGAGAFVKKTLAETKTILGLPGVRMKTGNYAGDGTNPHAITGVGFQPTFLIVWEQDGGDGVRFKSDQDTTYTKAAGGGYDGTEILSLDADGFTLHSAATVNQSGKTYTYVAFG